MNKRLILLISIVLLIVVYIVSNPLWFGLCDKVSYWGDGTKYCSLSFADRIPESIVILVGLTSIILVFLSLITYRMKEEVFRAWWNPARWWIPTIILATIIAESNMTGRGFFNMDAMWYAFFLAPLYALWVLSSLWKIYRAYRQKSAKEHTSAVV